MQNNELNPCKNGCEAEIDLDSDLMVNSWGARCLGCGQFQHGLNWDYYGAVEKWNEENPIKQ